MIVSKNSWLADIFLLRNWLLDWQWCICRCFRCCRFWTKTMRNVSSWIRWRCCGCCPAPSRPATSNAVRQSPRWIFPPARVVASLRSSRRVRCPRWPDPVRRPCVACTSRPRVPPWIPTSSSKNWWLPPIWPPGLYCTTGGKCLFFAGRLYSRYSTFLLLGNFV